MALCLIDRDHPLRPAAEVQVAGVYRRSFGAVIRAYPDLLAARLDAAGAPRCVAGVQFGLQNCFSEQYLDRPVEEFLGERDGRPVGRDEIIEVTTLASSRPAESIRLLRDIVDHGRSLGMRWGVFTATGRLRRALPRLGLELVALGPALRDRVANPQDWGSYYETAPWVCAIADRPVALHRAGRRHVADRMALAL